MNWSKKLLSLFMHKHDKEKIEWLDLHFIFTDKQGNHYRKLTKKVICSCGYEEVTNITKIVRINK